MNHIVRYESYSTDERLNDILDKISKYGISNLIDIEKEFLGSFQNGTEIETHNKIKYLENEIIFEDDFGIFKFEHKESKKYKRSQHHHGTIYITDCKNKTEECLSGRIIEYENGSKSLDFTSASGKDIFELCSGIEYELDAFVDYVVSEISDIKN